MHIGFRSSGGRGEYEVVGGHAGQSASGLEGWTFDFLWPDGIVRESELWLDPGDSGKPRLRSLANAPFQMGRIVTGLLLLPGARREFRTVASTLPVVRQGDYIVSKIGFGPDTTFASPPESVTAVPSYVEVLNQAHSDYIHVESRWHRISEVLARRDEFSAEVCDALDGFDELRSGGEKASPALNRRVVDVLSALDLCDSAYDGASDPLPHLEGLLGVGVQETPALPPPNELGDDEIDVKSRSAQMYRLARVRDADARRFAVDVRDAYGNRCAFCGMRLGEIPNVVSGIDAAHILAWGKYDLNVISNGMALCKNHHWAFDSGVMMPVISGSNHIVRFTQLAENIEKDTLRLLGSDGYQIPEEWLPSDTAMRPSAKYLHRLYDDLAVVF